MPSFASRTRRLLAAVGGAALALALTAPGATAAPGAPGQRPDFCNHDNRKSSGAQYLCAQAGDIVDVRIGDVLPTQPSLGYDEVYYKLGRYTVGKDAVNKKFADWCEASGLLDAVAAQPDATLSDPSTFTCTLQPGQETAESKALMKTVVIGQNGRLYLTDGHHTLTSFYEMPDGGPNAHVRLLVSGNLSQLTNKDFWATMQANKWVWLEDPNGNPVTVNKLPTSVGLKNFQDDEYRSLLYFARDIGYASGTVPFQEFYWGAWLRGSAIDLSGWNQDDAASYLATVKTVATAQVALPKAGVVYNGLTATQLGALAKVDTKEFDKLSKPLSDAKPGKIAYMGAYKTLLAQR